MMPWHCTISAIAIAVILLPHSCVLPLLGPWYLLFTITPGNITSSISWSNRSLQLMFQCNCMRAVENLASSDFFLCWISWCIGTELHALTAARHSYRLLWSIRFSLSSTHAFLFFLFLLTTGGRYPVILSIENHCSLEQQATMADIMRDTFGERLVVPEVDHSAEKLPSPQALKGKVLVKVSGYKGGITDDFPPEVHIAVLYVEPWWSNATWFGISKLSCHVSKGGPDNIGQVLCKLNGATWVKWILLTFVFESYELNIVLVSLMRPWFLYSSMNFQQSFFILFLLRFALSRSSFHGLISSPPWHWPRW